MAIDESTEGFLGLSVALEGLRQELEAAWEAGQGQRVRFRVSEVSLTVQAVASKELGGSGKVRWWLVEAGGEAKRGSETTQTLMLSLTPQVYDDQGRAAPLDVSGDQVAPGR
jgi:Trypsin-co-occurring domain 2